MGVPYYAGSRVVIYRTDLFKKAGVKKPPTSLGQFVADGKKLMAANSARQDASRRSTSPARTGTRRSAFVYDYGGQIATPVERQVGRHARLAAGDRRA